MLMALSKEPLHSLHKDNQNEVQHDLFGHTTQFAPALASHDADGIVNGTTTFLMLDNQIMATQLFVMCYHWCYY